MPLEMRRLMASSLLAITISGSIPLRLAYAEECPKGLSPDIKCKSVPCDPRLPKIEDGPFTCFEATYLRPPPPKKLLIRYNYRNERSFLIEFTPLEGKELIPGLRLHARDGRLCMIYGDREPICVPHPPPPTVPKEDASESSWNESSAE